MSPLTYPDALLYHPEHTWLIMQDGNTALVGITDFAQDQLGEVAFVDLPAIGSRVAAGDEFGTVESIKAVSALHMPITGTILAINEALESDPSAVNTSPYGDGWMIRIEIEEGASKAHLLEKAGYVEQIG